MSRRASIALIAVLCWGCSDTQVELADGGATRFSHWDGRWILINYWAEWCAPCRKEIPELNRLHRERNSTGVVVVGVNYDGLTGEKLEAAVAALGIEFPVLLTDPGPRWDQDPPMVLPSTLVIAPDGSLSEVLVGPHTYASFSRALNLTTSM